MHRLFGRKKETTPAPSMEETSAKLEKSVNGLDKQINDLNVKLNQVVRDIKNPANKARVPALKRKATDILKRRKALEDMQAKIEGQRFNVDRMSFQQQQIQTNIDTVNAMKAGNAAMKKQMKNIKVEDADDLMFDMENMVDDVNEISDLLSGPVGDDIDEFELEGELDALMGDMEGGISMDGLVEDNEPNISTAPEPVKQRW